MIKLAWRGIHENFSRSLFYWITFVLTTMFIFIFFNVACSEAVGMTFINSRNDVITYLCVFVMTICMIVIFFANDFYVKKKSKQMAIRLVSGATFLQITGYLLSSTLFIFFCAVPIGIALAILSMMFINNFILDMLQITTILSFNQQGILVTIVILLFVVIWCTILNVGYAYRSSIRNLLVGDVMVDGLKPAFPFHFDIKFTKYLYSIMFLLPICLFYIYGNEPTAMILFSVIGMIGLYGLWSKMLVPFLDQYIMNHIDYSEKTVYIGFMRRDLVFMKKNLILFIMSTILIITLLVSNLSDSMTVVLCFVSYVVIHCLLSLTVVFRFLVEILGRKNVFLTLSRIGYERKPLLSIITKEVIVFFGILMAVCLIYIGNILFSLYIHNLMKFDFIIMLITFFVGPLLICGCIVFFTYQKNIL